MQPRSTLFVDVCAQRDFWPGGAWPLVSPEEAERIMRLFELAADLGIRQGGVVCRHVAGLPIAAPGVPAHCVLATAAAACRPARAGAPPARVCAPDGKDVPALDRAHAYYVASGCADAPDATPSSRRVFDHLTAGVRDAVVFGAGVEYGIDRAVGALLRRRVRTHVALDAAAAADPEAAQSVVAGWKRRGVDGATAAVLRALLASAARS